MGPSHHPTRSSSSSSTSYSLSSLPVDLPANEVDEYIASLILADSSAKAAAYERHGLSAYLKTTGGEQRPKKEYNKRFLASVLRDVEGHNQAAIRRQVRDAQRAQEGRRRREGEGSSGRRTEEGKEKEADRKGKGKMRGWSEDESEVDNVSRSDSRSHSVGDPSGPSSRTATEQSKQPGDVSPASSLQPSSKMDKYFSPTYDPRRDTGDPSSSDRSPSPRPLSTREREREAKRQRKAERERIRAERRRRRERRNGSRSASDDEGDDSRHRRRHHRSHRDRDRARDRSRSASPPPPSSSRDKDKEPSSSRSRRHRHREEKQDEPLRSRRDARRDEEESRHREDGSRRHGKRERRPTAERDEGPGGQQKVREWDRGKNVPLP